MKMSHLFGGIVGGIAFGLVAGLLLGSCVFKAGPNHDAVGVERPGPRLTGAEAAAPPTPAVPGGMDPGSGTMESVFARVGELKKALERNAADRPALLELANLYYDAGKFDQAVPFYDRALAIDRNDPNVLTDAGNAYWQSGNPAKALEYLREDQQRFPSHWQSAVNLFLLAASQRNASLASDALDSVKRSNPNFEKLPEMERILGELRRGGGSKG